MKAALNGALNCSILDGWWDECYDGANGWAIESADDDPDLDRRDLREAGSLFSILEQQVVRAFYDRGRDGVPRDWVDDGAPGVGVARPAGHGGADGARLHDRAVRAGGGVGDPPRRRTAASRPSSWRRGGERVARGVGRRRRHVASTSTTPTAPPAPRRGGDGDGRRSAGCRPATCGSRSSTARSATTASSAAHADDRPSCSRRRPDAYAGEIADRRRRLVRRLGAGHPRPPRPGQPLRPRPRRLGRLATDVRSVGRDSGNRSAAGERRLAGAVLEEAGHADLAVLGAEHLHERRRARAARPSASEPRRARRRSPAWRAPGRQRRRGRPRRPAQRPRVRVVAVDELVGEADAQRLLGLAPGAR